MFANEEATLSLHKESLKGVCRDYVIKFNHEQRTIDKVVSISFDIVRQLIEELHQKDETVKGRLVALVHYVREEENKEVQVYHPSYQSEIINDVEDFFLTHMLKISERMEDLNLRGSNLLIKNISEIHLHLSCINK